MKGKIFLIANLKNLKLFRGLTAEEIEKFIQSTETKIKSYKRGERILEAFANNTLTISLLKVGSTKISLTNDNLDIILNVAISRWRTFT